MTLDTLITALTIGIAIFTALLAALWLSLVIWTFRDMRSRSRDPFAQILAALVVAILPFVGIIIYLILRPPETLAEAYERALEEEALLRELEETLTCDSCGVPVKDAWVFCPNCHNQLQANCASCGSLVRQEWDICVYCGSPKQATAQRGQNKRGYTPLEPDVAQENLGYRPVEMTERS